jgi:hypothetical protein
MMLSARSPFRMQATNSSIETTRKIRAIFARNDLSFSGDTILPLALKGLVSAEGMTP